MRVLMITNKWPTATRPGEVPFLVQQFADLQQIGVEMSRFTFNGHKNPLNYWQGWRQLRRSLDLSQFDVLHAQFGQCGLLGLPVRRPLVVTFHGSDLQGDVGADGRYTWPGRIMRQVSRFVAGRATANILVANHLRKWLPAGAAATVIPCGIDLALFCPQPQAEARSRLGLANDKQLVLFAANPSRPVKRYALAQAAVGLLQAEFPQLELLAVGNAPYQEMPTYLNACDILLLTSRHEGSPTIIKEALACNKAIVSVNVGDVAEQIGHVAGCQISDDSPAGIAQALRQLLLNPPQMATRPGIAHLDHLTIAQQILAVYHKSLSA